MRFSRFAVVAIAVPVLVSDVAAQNAVRPTLDGGRTVASMRASRRDGAITLDGRLDETAWQRAEAARDFVQSWPNPGEPGTDPTEVRVVYDENALYVAVRAFDSAPDSIAAQLARRDAGGIYSDWIHVIVDSYYDRRTAFRFTVNPKGVQKDVYTSNDGNEDTNWDAVWEVATRTDSLGWVAEYRIPLSQLRFGSAPAGQERVWGFQVMRDVARRNERVSFSPWVPDGRGFVSRFGDLTGLVDIPQPQRLEVVPYASTKVTSAPMAPGDANNPFYSRTDAKPSLGADVRYGLPAGLTLTATINPDFGQVELDPAVVNLSAFEISFPEKRPYFLEGSDIFRFGQLRMHNDYGGQTFLYTRRIGRAPSRFPSGPGVDYVDMPEQTTIAGAAKVTGKIGPWTMGLMNALTAEERARVAGPSGIVDSSTAVEPMTNVLAGRVRREFRRGQSIIGGMGTVMNRRQSEVFTNRLSTSSGFAGVDFEHRWSEGKYAVSGFSVTSRVNGSEAVISNIQRAPAHYFQRPDATALVLDPNRTSLTGHYNEVAFSKTGPWFGSVAVKEVSPGFEINDVGFHGRVDYRAVSPFWGYQSNARKQYTQNYFAGIWSNHAWNFDGTPIFQSTGGSANATFNNFWSAGINGNVGLGSFDDRLLRGGPLARPPRNYRVNAWLNSDTRRKVWFNPWVNYADHVGDDSWSASGGLYVETRPTSNLHVTLGPNYSRQISTSQYVWSEADANAAATYGRRYVFGNLDQTTVSMDARVNWTLSPKLSLQSYVQPFVAVGQYRDFKEFTAPRGFDFAVYGRDKGTITSTANAEGVIVDHTVDPDAGGPSPAFTFRNPNFNVHSLRGNAVLRWEYRPGSTLFFVWQQQRSGASSAFDFDTQRDVGAIFRERPTNIFLIKAAYWLSR